MTDLAEFLLARIAEDEEAANWASTSASLFWHLVTKSVVQISDGVAWDAGERAAAHAARHDPARVLAECEAKRRVVTAQTPAGFYGGEVDGWEQHKLITLRLLALAYAGHPDYREEWRP